jgi:hypothetical protein
VRQQRVEQWALVFAAADLASKDIPRPATPSTDSNSLLAWQIALITIAGATVVGLGATTAYKYRSELKQGYRHLIEDGTNP